MLLTLSTARSIRAGSKYAYRMGECKLVRGRAVAVFATVGMA
jgi:hypothetical protein